MTHNLLIYECFMNQGITMNIDKQLKEVDGYAIDGDDMNWVVECPDCLKEIEYKGFFESEDLNKCRCGCEFQTSKVWIDDVHYIK